MHTWWITSCPYVCAKAITVGWVEGSSKKERNVSLFPSATPLRRGRRWGWVITKSAQWAVACWVAPDKPGHSPVARCCNVPGVTPEQPGTRQAPLVSPDQWRLRISISIIIIIISISVITTMSPAFIICISARSLTYSNCVTRYKLRYVKGQSMIHRSWHTLALVQD